MPEKPNTKALEREIEALELKLKHKRDELADAQDDEDDDDDDA